MTETKKQEKEKELKPVEAARVARLAARAPPKDEPR
jgi:hypothetical protein